MRQHRPATKIWFDSREDTNMPVIANGGWYGAPGVTAAGAYGATPADMLYNLRNQGWSDQQIVDTYGPNDPMVRIMQLENQWSQARPNTGGYRYQYPSQPRVSTPSRTPSRTASTTQQGQRRTSGQTRQNQSRTVTDPGMMAAHDSSTISPSARMADPGMMAAHSGATDPGMMAAHSGATNLPASPVEGYRPTPEIVDAVRNTQAALGTLQTVIANGLNGLSTPPSSAGYAPTQEVADLVRNVRMPSMPDFGGTVDAVGAALTTPPSSAGYAPTQEVADLVRSVRMPDFGGTADAVGTALTTPPSSAGYAPTQEVADLVRNVRMPDFGGAVDAVGTALTTPPSSAGYAPTQEVADLVRNVRMPSMPSLPNLGAAADYIGTTLATPSSPAGYEPTQDVTDLVRGTRVYSMYAPTAQPPFTPGLTWVPAPTSPAPSAVSTPSAQVQEANPVVPPPHMTLEDLRNSIFDGLRGLGRSIPDFGGAADYAGAAATGVVNNARAAYTSPEGYAPTPEVVEMVRNTQPPQYPQPDPQYGWYGTLMQALAAPREALYNWLTR